MKKTLFTLLIFSLAFTAMAQDYNKLILLYGQKKWDDAKTEVDKLSADPKAKDKPETLLWKSAIYTEIFNDSTLAGKYPGIGQQAYDAFYAYYQKDPSLKIMKDQSMSRPLALLYSKSFNEGVQYFKDTAWANAYKSFRSSLDLGNIVLSNGLSTQKSNLDTFRVLYTAYAAQNAKMNDTAAVLYQQLADANLTGKEYENMYRFLLVNYSDKKDTQKFNSTLAKAKQLYPDDASLWNQFEMNNMTENTSMSDMQSKYKTDDAGGKLTADQYVMYAENFAGLNKGNQKVDSSQLLEARSLSSDAYRKAFALTNNGVYAFNTGVLYYQSFSDLSDKFFDLRGEGAALKTKRDAILKDQAPLADSAILWLEKAYDILKAKTDREKIDNQSLNNSVKFLANLYSWKRDRVKGISPKDYDKYDAKYQQYDAEYDKYK